MPRLAPSILLFAASQNVHLPALLRVCRDLPSARNELRWLTEHARQLVRENSHVQTNLSIRKVPSDAPPRSLQLKDVQCARRPHRLLQRRTPRKAPALPLARIKKVYNNSPNITDRPVKTNLSIKKVPSDVPLRLTYVYPENGPVEANLSIQKVPSDAPPQLKYIQADWRTRRLLRRRTPRKVAASPLMRIKKNVKVKMIHANTPTSHDSPVETNLSIKKIPSEAPTRSHRLRARGDDQNVQAARRRYRIIRNITSRKVPAPPAIKIKKIHDSTPPIHYDRALVIRKHKVHADPPQPVLRPRIPSPPPKAQEGGPSIHYHESLSVRKHEGTFEETLPEDSLEVRNSFLPDVTAPRYHTEPSWLLELQESPSTEATPLVEEPTSLGDSQKPQQEAKKFFFTVRRESEPSETDESSHSASFTLRTFVSGAVERGEEWFESRRRRVYERGLATLPETDRYSGARRVAVPDESSLPYSTHPQKENEDLNTETEDLRAENEDLNTETEDLRAETEDLNTETEDLRAEAQNLQPEIGEQTADSLATLVGPPGTYLSQWSEARTHEAIVDESGNIDLEIYREKLLEWQYNFVKKTKEMIPRRARLKRLTHQNRRSPPMAPNKRMNLKQQEELEQMLERHFLEEKYLELEKAQLARLVAERARGKPLQYVIGNQPFGNLEIICRPGVLIPRPETETYTEEIGRLLHWLARKHVDGKFLLRQRQLRILDLCTGSGCIALYLYSILKPAPGMQPPYPRFSGADLSIRILGIDISEHAIKLARENLKHNISKGFLHPDAEKEIVFIQQDIMKLASGAKKIEVNEEKKIAIKPKIKVEEDSEWDVVVSNPPYISARGYSTDTESSVRKYEPIQALVPSIEPEGTPPDPLRTKSSGDQLYMPIIRIARDSKAKLIAMEVGDTEQASRILARLRQKLTPVRRLNQRELKTPIPTIEAWRDDGSIRRVFEPVPRELPIRRVVEPVPNLSPGSMSRQPTTDSIDPNLSISSDTAPGDELHTAMSDRIVVAWIDEWAEWRRHHGPTDGNLDVEYVDPEPEPAPISLGPGKKRLQRDRMAERRAQLKMKARQTAEASARADGVEVTEEEIQARLAVMEAEAAKRKRLIELRTRRKKRAEAIKMQARARAMRGKSNRTELGSLKRFQAFLETHKKEDKERALLAKAVRPRDKSSKKIVNAVLAETRNSPRRAAGKRQTASSSAPSASKKPPPPPQQQQKDQQTRSQGRGRNPEDVISKWVS
ncbi:hypothetical protein PV10_06143 [Exophiala mesophila]|uniref:Type II methyltransferase M.TaqI-like domain-containing protein n=1 Tax=Exophiala mesophila TaxID=212818 RepID=A0A0D1WR82_EXOME|nr:uncharacterized protein PV10_06143 [Exophiala mesophila]KIV91625.1 hypothetical protein PV10_06143 [Exophiala mesophila]